MLPTRHLTSFTELSPEAADALGGLLRRLGLGLESVIRCVKTYQMRYSEAEGFEHLHVHLVPRMADQPADLRGPAIFGYLTDDRSRWIPPADQDAFALSLRAALGGT